MKAAIGKQLNNGIVIAVAIVLAIAIWSIWHYQRIQDIGSEVRHLDSVLLQTNDATTTYLQIVINLQKRDSSAVEIAGDSIRQWPAKIAALKRLTVNDGEIARRVDTLDHFYGQWLAPETQTITDGDRVGFIYGVLTGIKAVARKEINQLRAINQGRAFELQWGLWALSAAVVALGLAVFRRIRLDIGQANMEREQANMEREQANVEREQANVEREQANVERERANEEREQANEEREQAKFERDRSEEKYKMLFYKSPLPKWIFDEESLQFLEVNEAAVRLYGYSEEEFRKLTLADIRPREDVDRFMTDIGEVRRNPGSFQAGQWRHRRKDGEVMEVEVTAHPVELDGRRARMVAVVDITDRREHERQLERLYSDLARRATELSASNAELERFAYIASHDLQEPLRMVSSFLQLLQKKYSGQLDERADQYIHYAVDGAERMKALIMDLLEYSRLGTGKEAFDQVDVNEVMAEVGEVFREQIGMSGAEVRIGSLPIVWGDRVQLTQLFQNLMSNALKYSGGKPPVIKIGAEEHPDRWQFSVADNGIGIDPQFFDKIFIIFQRLHNRNEYTGTGIGLAICKKIVERHGGRIWVESGSGEGSTFYFTINKKM